jgi:hypothetical protein
VDGVTGVLFEEQTVACVIDAIVACQALSTRPEELAVNAERFSAKAFADGLTRAIEATRELRALDICPVLPMSAA